MIINDRVSSLFAIIASGSEALLQSLIPGTVLYILQHAKATLDEFLCRAAGDPASTAEISRLC